MSQYPSHSNTPQFDANKSQTSERLYQYPTHEEMWGKKPRFGSNFFAGLFLFLLFSGLAYMCIVTADREQAREVERMVKIGSTAK